MPGRRIAHILRMGRCRGGLDILRLSIVVCLGLTLNIAEVFTTALLSSAVFEDSPSAAQARGKRGGGGGGSDGWGGDSGGGKGSSGGRDRFDGGSDRDSFRSRDDDRQQQTRNSDKDDRDQQSKRRRDDDDDDDRDSPKSAQGSSTGTDGTNKSKGGSKQPWTAPKTVSEMLGRMVVKSGSPLGSVSSDLFDLQIGGLSTNEILAVNSGPGLLEQAQQLGFGVEQKTTLGLLGFSIVKLIAPHGMGAGEARALLERRTRGAHFAFNHVYRPYRPATGDHAEALPPEPSDADGANACSGRCYAQRVIKWQSNLQSCALKTRIGFIDASVDVHHPALAGRKIQIGDFRRTPKPTKISQHGTSTLAVLAGGPGGTVAGLLPESEYFAADIFFPDEQGEPVADTMALLLALDWMSAWGVRLVNLSLAGPHDPLMQQAIASMAHKGVVFIAAAGNDGPDGPPLYPAAYKDVIAVSAVAKDLRSYHRGNRGNYIDVSAPGVAIWTAVPGGEGFLSGTSFAVPFVTAIIATISGQITARDKNSLLAALEYKDLGPPGRDAIFGRGLVLAPRRCKPARDAPQIATAKAPAAIRTGWSPETTAAQTSEPGFAFTATLGDRNRR